MIRPSASRNGSPRDWNQTIQAVRPAQTVLKIVGLASFDRTSPSGNYTRKIIWVNGVRRAPLLQLLKRSAEVIQDLSVNVLDLTFRGHDVYWSATISAEDPAQAWIVSFSGGTKVMTVVGKFFFDFVWCVRGGQGVEAQ
jgi:hypothetical protein